MMRHSRVQSPQFYVTAPQPCPYLHGRTERKLFTAAFGEDAHELSNVLSRQGFRRSQNVLYRPSCEGCTACFSARIRVRDFKPSRAQAKIARRNGTLRRQALSCWATEEQFALFRSYLDRRHADGGMADMDVFEFAAMVEETPVRSRVIEYRLPPEPDHTGATPTDLAAVALTDVMDDGLSMVYSFYDPDLMSRSLGTYLILDHIRLAREAGLDFVYLGYWVPGSAKMDYKSRFSAIEIYKGGIWQDLGQPEDHADAAYQQETVPIVDQVARIALPGQVTPPSGF